MKDIIKKMVLGTAQFGMDYGIANVSGKPKKKEVFGILDLAWEKGVRRFDTAPDYGSEVLLGEFILANGIQDKAIVLTKIPSLDGAPNYQQRIRTSLESSLKNLRCPFDVLFFHNPVDSDLLLKNPQFFENLMCDYQVSALGVSVYEPQEVDNLLGSHFELAFQFPFNVLDRRFGQVSMSQGKRYARSIFLQGLLASSNSLRLDAPVELLKAQKKYHVILANHHLDPIGVAVSFTVSNDAVDYFLFGVDSEKHLRQILDVELYEKKDIDFLVTLQENTPKKWFDPRKWN